MIVGIGVDVVDLVRIKKITKNKPIAFVKRILAEPEIEKWQALTSELRRCEYLAGRFAAKEAAAKALGTGIGAASFTEMITTHDECGKPKLSFLGQTLELAQTRAVNKVWLSISHTETIATAFVILEA